MATSREHLNVALVPSSQAIGHDRNPGELSRSVFEALIRHRGQPGTYQLHWFTPAGRFKRFDDERRTRQLIAGVCAKAHAAAREMEGIHLLPPPKESTDERRAQSPDAVGMAHIYLHTLVLALVGEALRNMPPAQVDRRWKKEQALVINLLEERVTQ